MADVVVDQRATSYWMSSASRRRSATRMRTSVAVVVEKLHEGLRLQEGVARDGEHAVAVDVHVGGELDHATRTRRRARPARSP